MRRILKDWGVLFWVWVCFQQNVSAQEFIPEFRSFSNAEGLSQSVVFTVFQDSKNFLWFGTEDGLNKFDGINFKIYRYDPEDLTSISDNWVDHIFMEDRDGDIWMVTNDKNINVFSPRYEQFVKISHSGKSKGGFLPFDKVFFIKQDLSGSVWVSTDKGLFVINKKSWDVKQVHVNNDDTNPRYFRYFQEDEQNNIWLGSNKGLLIWDINTNKIECDFFNGLKDQERSVQGIQNDTAGNIWVVTEEEIIGFKNTNNYYKIISYQGLLGPEDEKLETKRKRGLFAFVKSDIKNNLWICTQRGLVLFNATTSNVSVYLHNADDKTSISSNYILSFYEDKKGNLWFGTINGLNQFVPETGNFLSIAQKPGNMSTNIIISIFEDKSGRVWVLDYSDHHEGSYLCFLDQKSKQLVHVQKNILEPRGLPIDMVYEPFIDHQGNLWFGTYGSGVLLYAPFQKKFDLIKHIPGNKNSIAGNSSWAISEDAKGRIWLALFQDGLDCYDPATGTVVHYKDKLGKFINAKNYTVISAVCDRQNRLWIGTMGQGVVSMDLATGKMTHFLNKKGYSNYLSSNYILAITIDKKGNLIISYAGSGFDILNPVTGKITNYVRIPSDENSLHNNGVRYVIESSDGNYWISSDGAITFFDRSKGIMTHYLSRKAGGKGILADKASCIYEDSKANIWVGTHGGGLSLFDKKKKEFKHWTEKNGLVNNVIYGILEDSNNQLWISTNNGISRFDPITSKFTNYFVNDGLQGNEFNANSFYKIRNGKMYFGGINGITAFYPEEIHVDPITPQVSITGFQIFNKKVEVLPYKKRHLAKDTTSYKIIEDDGHLYLPSNISYTTDLLLDYDYKVFTFEFVALNFDMPERCTFMYKMEGFEDEWNIAGHRRFATYTNLPPGEYFFKVTAANADGIWNPEPVKIRIIIKPPFYLTWWFISFGIGLLIIASTSFVLQREKNLKKTKNILEEKVKLRTQELNDKNEELTLRNIQILKQKEEIANQAKRLRVEMDAQHHTSELALLRSQINPHFLFNTLNNIYSLVYQKSCEAPEALMKLSDIMRYMLYDTASDNVLVEQEIKYLKSFIELQLLRLKNKDFVSFEISGDPSGKMIAPMLLIPFVENAFKHGSKSVTSPGIIIILNCKPDSLSFQVKNKKSNSTSKDSLGGIGLVNVRRRLELIYHENYSLEIVDDDEKFEINLVITEKLKK